MALRPLQREIAKAERLTKKIAAAEVAVSSLYIQRCGLAKDQWFVWCRACGRHAVPMDGVETCPSCKKGRM